MKKFDLLLDTNIVIDFLNHRDPHFDDVRLLMIAARVGEFNLWITSSQITDVIYIATNGGDQERVPPVLDRLKLLRLVVNVMPVSESDIDRMLATKWSDPEDALLFDLALKAHIDAIITRDEDFKKAIEESGIDAIRVFDCTKFFEWLNAEHGVSYAELPF